MQTVSQPVRGFPKSEFENRLIRAQKLMRQQNLDALLLCTETEVRYFSGFLTEFWQSPTRPWFLIVPANGDPIAIIPGIGAECMGRTWISDIRCWASPNPSDEGVSLLVQVFQELNANRIGLPMGQETQLRMSLEDFDTLRSTVSGEFVNCTQLIRSLQIVKSSLEIDKIRFAATVASDAFEQVPHIIKEGMTDAEAFRAYKIECLKAGADAPTYLVGGAGQGGYGDIISPPAGRKLIDGDIMILDVGCVFDGYFCDFDRNFAIGKPTDEAQKAYEVVWQATEAGLTAARPGVSCSHLFKVMADHMSASGGGGADVGRLGHGLGMRLTEHPSLAAFDDTILSEGMVMTLEPGMSYLPGKMMVHEENIVIRDGAPELLSRRAHAELPVI